MNKKVREYLLNDKELQSKSFLDVHNVGYNDLSRVLIRHMQFSPPRLYALSERITISMFEFFAEQFLKVQKPWYISLPKIVLFNIVGYDGFFTFFKNKYGCEYTHKFEIDWKGFYESKTTNSEGSVIKVSCGNKKIMILSLLEEFKHLKYATKLDYIVSGVVEP